MPGGNYIDERTIKEADKCPFNHECLNNPQRMCPPDRDLGNEYVLLKDFKQHAYLCPYKVNLGTVKACHCPVRFKMFFIHNL